jgi:CelD/BcsL family acetyltransferase involved in cellulose biosynthesis
MSHELTVRTFNGLGGLSDSRTLWQEVFAASGSENPFLTWEWNKAWASTYAPDKAIRVLVAEAAGKPVAVVPLLSTRRHVSFLIDPFFADYADFLVAGDAGAVFKAFLERCMETGKEAVFGPIRGCGHTGRLLVESAKDLGRPWLLKAISSNPCVLPASDFDSYMEGRNKRVRQEIRTTLNHLNRGGGWEFVECNGGAPANEILDSLICYHHGRQGGKAGHSIFGSSENQEFFRSLPDRLAEGPARAHLSAIAWQGRFVSAAYSLVCGKTLFYWIPSFDQSIKGVSLGKLHIKCLLEKCFAAGMTFDFMGGDEPYKYQWANHGYENVRVHIFSSRLQKAAVVGIRQATEMVREAKRRSAFLDHLWRRLSKVQLGVG